MSIASLWKNKMNFELFKVMVITSPLFIGSIIFTVFLLLGYSSLRNYLFYLFIAILIISSQVIVFLMRRKGIRGSGNHIEVDAKIPSSFSKDPISSPKESVKIDEHSVSYCLSCGKSFTKKYSFCPKCGSCKISSFI